MRNIILAAAALLILSCSGNIGSDYSFPLQPGAEDFNSSWLFTHDGQSGRTVDLPHDWGVEGEFKQEYPGETGKLLWWGVATYSKPLAVSEEDLQGCIFLEVDGAMSNATVEVNGTPVGGWPYGYASWRVDLTPALKAGANEIAVKLDNKQESSRWYPGGGIYRNVRLVRVPKAGIAHWGVAVTTPNITEDRAEVQVQVTLRCEEGFVQEGTKCLIRTYIHEEGSDKVLSEAEDVTDMTDGAVFTRTLAIDTPKLWTLEDRALYVAEVEVSAACSELHPAYHDSQFAVFGVRTAEWRPDGFFLNGEHTFLKGVCLHHDAGALGAAWHTDAWVRRLLKLKEMGCNAIRTSHNPPAPEFLDLCDRMGFLVLDEFTDTWTVSKKENGYATLFDEWAEKDLVAMIHRDRNHPSIIAWSIGNEVGEQGIPDKWHIAQELTDICHREDPSRPTTSGNDNQWASTQPFADAIDLYGFNYKPHAYAEFRDTHPGKPVYGSETASTISTRGYYLFPVSNEKMEGWIEGAPYQVSSYDLYAPKWSTSPDYEWFFEDSVPECAGEFVWTGYDYLGEPTPYNLDLSILTNFHTEEEKQAALAMFESWGAKVMMEPLPSRSSYFGIIDLAGFPKDRFWLYQARWRPDLAFAHILPHWTWPGREGEVTPVHVYSTGRYAELFVNGKSQGVRERGDKEYRFRWDDVVYEPGEVKVNVYADKAAYDAGKLLATDVMRTAGDPARINLKVDYKGSELVYVSAAVLDKDGNLVPGADNLLTFSVKGDARLLATDAGDPTSHSAFINPSIKAFNGLASAVITRTGRFTVTASSDGLTPASLKLSR